jgi:hypothetical protein
MASNVILTTTETEQSTIEDNRIIFLNCLNNEHKITHKRGFFSQEEITKMITAIITAKDKVGTKTAREYHLLSEYDVLKINTTQKLIKKQEKPEDIIKYIVAAEDLYDFIEEAHKNVGHGGQNRTYQEVKLKYYNITNDQCALFKTMCKQCASKAKKKETNGLVINPIISTDFNSRGQVDLVDFQSFNDGEDNWMMHYQDHFTKFSILRPLKSKKAAEVALHLLDIFSTFGAPYILQSDDGRVFTARIIEELGILWPELKIIHEPPRHLQSQCSVERDNDDIKDMLRCWLQDNNTNKWSVGLKFVQFQKNRAIHSGIGRSPYEALFGRPAKVGLNSSSITKEDLKTFDDENDLLKFNDLPILPQVENPNIIEQTNIIARPTIIRQACKRKQDIQPETVFELKRKLMTKM